MALMPMFWGRNDMMVGGELCRTARAEAVEGEGEAVEGEGEAVEGEGEAVEGEGEAIGNVEKAGRS
jgi:hypothetical protein